MVFKGGVLTEVGWWFSLTPVCKLLNNCMNKTALHDIQKTLNNIRNQIDAVDADTKWAALELMLPSSASIVALSRKMTKPNTKTGPRKISIPKTKVFKRPVQQASKTAANDAARTAINPVALQKPLSVQKISG